MAYLGHPYLVYWLHDYDDDDKKLLAAISVYYTATATSLSL